MTRGTVTSAKRLSDPYIVLHARLTNKRNSTNPDEKDFDD